MDTEKLQQRMIYRFGERAGIGIIAIFAIIFLTFQSPEQASSEEKLPQPVKEVKAQEMTAQNVYTESPLNYPQVTVTSSQAPTSTPDPTPTPTIVPAQIVSPIPTLAPLPTITPTQAISPSPTQAQAVDASSDAIWDELAKCEAGGNWAIDTGNGYYGGLQFSQSAWEGVGGTGNPAHASREEQIMRGKMLQERRGWGAWGMCAVRLGLN